MRTDLHGRRALVTGGGTGIGRAVALSLAAAGADVALTYRSHDGAAAAQEVRELGRRAVALPLDATDSGAVDAAVTQAQDELAGPVDILVNNVGGLVGRRTVPEMSDEHWHQVLDLNLSSAFYVTRAVIRSMPDGGRVVTIGSVAGQNGGGPGAVAYATAKAGIDGFTRGMAKELAPRRITVNAVAPGFITDTPFHATHTPEPDQRASIAATLLGRAGTPAEVADAVLFLASDAGGFSTGAVLDVNGGAWFH